jgi:LysM repeat protein
MKTNPKSPRRKKKPEPVVDIDENIFNPFAPVLSMFRRRGKSEGDKKPRAFRHDFALVLLLHVIAILAFVAHGSVKRYTAAQKPAPAAAKKQEKSVVEEIVKSSPGSAPEMIETKGTSEPGKHALRAVHETDPFLPEKVTKPEPRTVPGAAKPLAKKPAKEEPAKQTAKAGATEAKPAPLVPSPTFAKQGKPSHPAPTRAPVTNDAATRRAFLEVTGRIEPRQEPRQIQTAVEPETRRADPVVRPTQSETKPSSPELRPAVQPAPLPSGAVAWSTQPLEASAGRTAEDPQNQGVRPSEYTVAPGDNLEVISKRLGVGYEQLAALNNLSSSRDLQIGRQLVVPEAMRPL